MKQFISILILSAAITFGGATMASAQSSSDGFLMTETEKDAIREIVEDYIKNNPEVIIEVLNERAKEDAEKQAQTDRTLSTVPDGLYDYPLTPKIGPDDAKVKVVEFFDYNCGFCKRVIGDVNRAMEANPNVQFIFKELPILSDESRVVARYALAANMQGKYFEFHQELMSSRGRVTEETAKQAAGKIGLDLDQLEVDAQSQGVSDALDKNMEIARELGVRGTPFFVIGKEKVPGAIGYSRIQSLIDQGRG